MDAQSLVRSSLSEAVKRFGRNYVAQELDTSLRTLERWEQGMCLAQSC